MANNTTVIDITAKVNDQTSSGVASAKKNLTGLEQTVQSLQTTLNRMQSSQFSVRINDQTSSGVSSATRNLSQLEQTTQSAQNSQVVARVTDQTSSGVSSASRNLSQLEQTAQSAQNSQVVARVTDQTTSGVTSASRNLSQLEQSARSAESSLGRIQSRNISVTAVLRDMASSGLRSITTLGDRLVGKAWSVTANLIDNVTAPLRSILSMVASPITQMVALTGVTMGAADTVSTYMGYEQSLANTKAVTGASDEDMGRIAEMVKGYGATTAFSASQVGTASTVLGTAGWSADQMIDGMGSVLSLASAGDVEIDTSASIISATMGQWGMEASQTQEIADVLASTASSSMTTVTGLGETFAYAGAMAGTLGFSVQDVAIATGLMGNSAINASMAGTSLRSFFGNMVSPTDETAGAMSALGISLTDTEGNMNSLLDIMTTVRSSMADLSETEQSAYASALAGTTGLSGFLAIVNAEQDVFDSLTDSIYGAEGAAQGMADIRMDTLQGDVLAFQSAVEGVKIEIGERLTPSLRSFVQYATNKMPDVGNAIQSAMEWTGSKVQDFSVKVTTLTESEEWGNSNFSEKVTLAWDTLVADPFGEWWEQDGRRYALTMADNAGTFLGGIVNGGLLTILGIDIGDAASDGMLLGKTFFTSFMEQIDTVDIASGILSAAGSVVKEGAKILPFGEEATAASWLAAGATGYTGAKMLQAGSVLKTAGTNAVTTGSTMASNVGTFVSGITPTTVSTTATNALAKVGTALTSTTAKLATGATAVFDAFSGASKSTEWLGNDSLSSQGTSAVASVIGGSGDGIFGEGSLFEKGFELVSGGLKGFTVGGVGGAVAGTAAAAVGGENIAKFTSGIYDVAGNVTGLWGQNDEKTSSASSNAVTEAENTKTALMEELKTEMTTAVSEMEENVVSSVEDNSELLGDSVGTILEETLPTAMEESLTTAVDSSGTVLEDVFSVFFCETIPTYMEEMFLALEDTLTEQITLSSETMMEDLGLFFGETMPSFFTELWTGLEEALMEQSTLANEEINLANSLFFAETLPLCFQDMWLTVEESLAEQSLLSATTITERSGLFLEEFLPTSMDNLWITTESSILEQSLLSQMTINSGVVEFYGVYIPSSIQKIWDSGKSAINASSATASAKVNSSAISFFSSASGSVSSFFSSAQSKINSAMASAASSLSSLSVSSPSTSSASATAYANGGILSSPHLGLVAEDGPEAIIPLSGKRRSRGIELWEEAGKALGVTPYANGGMVGAFSDSSNENKVLITSKSELIQGESATGGNQNEKVLVQFGDIILNVTATGNTDGKSITDEIKEHLGELTDEIANRLAISLKKVYENMPLTVEI